MGDRAQVAVKQRGGKPVYLYTHWNGSELEDTVRDALAKRWRWDDPMYLTRIVFCEMVKGDEASETGFGIGLNKQGDLNKPLITLDPCATPPTVTIGKRAGTFEEFVTKKGAFA